MKTASRVWAVGFMFVFAAAIAPSGQQPPCCFAVLNAIGRPVIVAHLGDAPYKHGFDEPSVDLNLDGKRTVLDKNRQVISDFRFYGWREGGNVRVVVVARLPPEGAENRVYNWPELNKAGMKPRLEIFATYTLAPGETAPMDELKALGVEAIALRTESKLPPR
jgi:hypothetical protein